VQAVFIDSNLNNVTKSLNGGPVQSQKDIAQFLSEREYQIKAL